MIYLLYIEDSSPKVKSFISKTAYEDFVEKWNDKHKNLELAMDNGDWLELSFNGKVEKVYDEHYKRFFKKKRKK